MASLGNTITPFNNDVVNNEKCFYDRVPRFPPHPRLVFTSFVLAGVLLLGLGERFTAVVPQGSHFVVIGDDATRLQTAFLRSHTTGATTAAIHATCRSSQCPMPR